jgi:PTS system nitrogen regulatory IIA component
MRLAEILNSERIVVDPNGALVHDKNDAMRLLGQLLAPALGIDHETVERLLMERERLQSTGIGEGVAIPHTSVDAAAGQAGALLLCPRGVPFESIDGRDVNIVFGVVGPKRATGEHLKTLARISRLLRDTSTRERLVASESPDQAFALIQAHDGTAT